MDSYRTGQVNYGCGLQQLVAHRLRHRFAFVAELPSLIKPIT